MARRMLLAVLVVAVGGLGAVWWSAGTFTVTRTVAVEPRSVLNDPMPRITQEVELTIRCTSTSSHYVTDSGAMMGFNEATGTPETPGPLCDDARAQRRRSSAAFVVFGLLAGGAVLVAGLLRDRRVAEFTTSPVPAVASSHADSAV